MSTAASTVTMGSLTYGYSETGQLLWVASAGDEIQVAGGKPPPEVPWECWHRSEPWDAERAHAATLAACRGQH